MNSTGSFLVPPSIWRKQDEDDKAVLFHPPGPAQTCSPCPLPCQRDLHRQTVDQSLCQSRGLQQVSARLQLPQSPLPRREVRAFQACLVQCGLPVERTFEILSRHQIGDHLALHKTGGAILLDKLAHNEPNVLTAGDARKEEELILPARAKIIPDISCPPLQHIISTRPTCFLLQPQG